MHEIVEDRSQPQSEIVAKGVGWNALTNVMLDQTIKCHSLDAGKQICKV